jgi:hypothetical protein
MPIRDVALGRVAVACGGIALTVFAAVAFVLGELWWWQVPTDGAGHAEPPAQAAGPAEQSAPQSDRDRERARDAARLRELGWADRSAGLARIPVDEAMTLMSERGLRAVVPASGAAP